MKNSKQSLVDLLEQQLSGVRKPGIMGNIHRSVVFQFIEWDIQSSTQHIDRLAFFSAWKPLHR